MHRVLPEQRVHGVPASLRECNDECARRAFVEPMHGIHPCTELVGEQVENGLTAPTWGVDDQHRSRLVDDQEVVVLVQDRDRRHAAGETTRGSRSRYCKRSLNCWILR